MDYNKENYKLILESAINQRYEFVNFFTLNLEKPAKQIILRHDIDFSPALALEMAKIDAAYKIKSTFALLLSSPLYNPFTSPSINIVNEIQQLGHHIALHHRVVSAKAAEKTRQAIVREMQVMRTFFPYIQPVFIWHNPPSNNLLSDIRVLGMVNAYSTPFVQSMQYISDSNLRNKPEKFLAVLDNHQFIHMVLHPIVWMSGKDNIVSMLAYILSSIIHGCDHEFLLNPTWKRRFPNGIPEEPLNQLEVALND